MGGRGQFGARLGVDGRRGIFLLHSISILFELDLVLYCLPRLLLLASFLQLIVDLFGIKDKEDALEQFLAYLIRGSLGRVLTVKSGTIGICCIQFYRSSTELFVF